MLPIQNVRSGSPSTHSYEMTQLPSANPPPSPANEITDKLIDHSSAGGSANETEESALDLSKVGTLYPGGSYAMFADCCKAIRRLSISFWEAIANYLRSKAQG